MLSSNVQVMRRKRNRVRGQQMFRVDYWLLLAVAGLMVVGILMVYSSTFDDGILVHQDATYFLKRQFWALLLGLVGMAVVLQFDYHSLRLISVPALGLTLVALFILLFFGEAVFGARRGIYAGSYQPSEVAKLTMVIYIAHWISSKGERIKDLTYGLLPFSIITGVVCALIVGQPDLSTAGLLAQASFALFFIAGADLKQFGIVGVVGVATFLFLMLTLPYARVRVDDYLTALRNPIEGSYQLRQVLIALGTGHWFGVGLGEGFQKFGPLPAAHTDGIFAIWAEETGFVGSLTVLALYSVFVWRGLRIATRARDQFGFLLAVGLTCWLTFQALMNIAVITAVIPFTGISLPFISYGGSSLVVSLLAVGILLSISRDAALARHLQTRRTDRRPAAESVSERFDLWRRDRRPHLPGARRRG